EDGLVRRDVARGAQRRALAPLVALDGVDHEERAPVREDPLDHVGAEDEVRLHARLRRGRARSAGSSGGRTGGEGRGGFPTSPRRTAPGPTVTKVSAPSAASVASARAKRTGRTSCSARRSGIASAGAISPSALLTKRACGATRGTRPS